MPASPPPEKNDTQTVVAKSARGATFLIFLQIGSRALTFIVNQVLLRYLSPELLGISTQLELYAISVLYFARESLRVALQRQGKTKAQEIVNLSWIAIAFGPILAFTLAQLYVRKASGSVLATPYIHESLTIYACAAVLELFIEPCFVIAQQQMLYGTRASAEASATFTRCLLTAGTAIWASKLGYEPGALPFAVGQLSYAIVLNVVYYGKIWGRSSNFSLFPRLLPSGPQQIYFLWPQPVVNLAVNLYAQSGLKHILTQGDSLLIALFTSLAAQGVYALASNYGSLLARMLFQPIEESSRSLFGRLLTPSSSTKSDEPSSTPKPSSKLVSAHSYLRTVLHFYSLLSLTIATVGPTLAPLLLRYIAGPAWASTPAGSVLSIYCYYIPLLAINGILEAFVSAVATPMQLRRQSAWMLVFSATFAVSGYICMRVYDGGAKGLVAANAINMAMRIVWSWSFVKGHFDRTGKPLKIDEILPGRSTTISALTIASTLRIAKDRFDGSIFDLIKTAGISGLFGVVLLVLERKFLLESYRMIRPSAPIKPVEASKKER